LATFCLTGESVPANFDANAASTQRQASGLVNIGKGCRTSITASSREQQRSGVLITHSPQKSTPLKNDLSELWRTFFSSQVTRTHAAAGDLQGRQNTQ